MRLGYEQGYWASAFDPLQTLASSRLAILRENGMWFDLIMLKLP